MDQENYIKLVKELVQKTEQKKIPWKKTPDNDKFISSINSEYSLAIKETDIDHIIVFINNLGEEIDQISSYDLEKFNTELINNSKYHELLPFSDTLSDLFYSARRQALGGSKAVSSMLGTIEKDEIVDTVDKDDEIPF